MFHGKKKCCFLREYNKPFSTKQMISYAKMKPVNIQICLGFYQLLLSFSLLVLMHF